MAEKKNETKKVEEEPAAPEIKPTAFLAPGIMLGMRYFKVDLSIYLQELRIAFAVVIVLKFLVILWMYIVSQRGPDEKTKSIIVKEKGVDGVEKTTKMTVKEYDASQAWKTAGSSLFALCITCGIHYKWGNPTPLLFQCIMGPIGMFDDKLFKIHILGQKAEGKLARPFVMPPSPLQELMGGGETAKPAEKEKRGKKEKTVKAE